MMRRVVGAVAVVLVGCLVAMGCSSAPDTASEVAVESEGPEMTVGEAYRAAAEFVPANSLIAYASVHEGLGLEYLGDDLLPLANPNAVSGDPGTVEGLIAELRELTVASYGIDVSNAKGVVIAGSPDGALGGMWLGEFGEPRGLETTDIEGHTIHEIDISELTEDLGGLAPQTLYIRPIESPRPGLAWNVDPTALVPQSGASGNPVLAEHFDTGHGARIAVAADIEGLMKQTGGAAAVTELPSSAFFALGERRVHLDIYGDEQPLAMIEQTVATFVDQYRQQISESYHDNDGALGPQAMLSVYSYHFAEGLAPQLQPERRDNRLRYEVMIGDVNSMVFSLYAVTLGGMSQILMQEFNTYETTAKTSEAHAIASQMSMQARAYFEGNQLWSSSDGAEPWHQADPDASGKQLGMPVEMDKKVFPGGPNITLRTGEFPPQGGEKNVAEFLLDGDVDFEPHTVANVLGFHTAESHYFLYTYETGPGTGTEATATISATANFDPSTRNSHTVVIELSVDDNGRVVESPVDIRHSGQ